jgi:hypothetical protein
VRRVAISVDGASAEAHDAFRGFRGSFQTTQGIARDVVAVGLSLQINTTITRYDLRPGVRRLALAPTPSPAATRPRTHPASTSWDKEGITKDRFEEGEKAVGPELPERLGGGPGTALDMVALRGCEPQGRPSLPARLE